MKNYMAKYRQNRRALETNFANFNGEEENPLLQRANMTGSYANMGGASPLKGLSGPSKELYVKIVSTDASDLIVDLFGHNLGLTDPFDTSADSAGTSSGAGTGIVVTIGGQSHEVFKKRSVHKPFLIEGFRGIYPNATQLQEDIKLITEDNNLKLEKTYSPSAHITAGQQQSNQVDDGTFNFLITGDSRMQFLVKAGVQISFVLNVRAVSDLSQLLQGETPLAYNQGQIGGADLY